MASKALQLLMKNMPRGVPIDADRLRAMDISPQQATNMVNSGWLQRLSKGAYVLAGDTPTREGVLIFLGQRVPGMHVGGKTALEWQGVRHNISFRERVILWGERPYAMPEWIELHMPHTYQTTAIFDDGLPKNIGLAPLPNGSPHILVSIPERALLELASDIGKQGEKGQSLEEALNLMPSLRNLRTKQLEQLLNHCTRAKVVKLVRDLGASSGYQWGQDLQKYVDRLGPGKRWSSSRKNAPRFTLKA
jgi:hypothetical protein